MFNNRMLAVAAVLVLAVPVLGAAAPVVVPTATPEQLVEGHTVFTVIEVSRNAQINGTTRFAAAVAVLVREYTSENRNVRFPGVLWFNDQYLVNPESGEDGVVDYRYPCGGAVMAVNRGDPDPRVNLAGVGVTTAPGQTTWTTTGSAPHDNVNASVDASGATPTASASSDALVNSMGLPIVTPATYTYKETYTITDPNDHMWVIDRYNGYSRTSQSLQNAPVYQFPVWVVNIMGTPAFIPDDGSLSCTPFYDGTLQQTNQLSCGTNAVPAFGLGGQDDPCAGYAQPSRNGYCYSGQPAADFGNDCSKAPIRLYNAVLYFKLEDLTDEGAPRTHTTASTDTNGCQQGTEWTCPSGSDDAEGNSHPFHPTTAAGHTDTGPCTSTSPTPNPNPTNHGGSAGATPGSAVNGQYGPLPCDYTHATRDIDIYFSATGRPARPAGFGPVAFAGTGPGSFYDAPGSEAPFQNYPTAYGTTH